jgi:probable addiction module antidote protein
MSVRIRRVNQKVAMDLNKKFKLGDATEICAAIGAAVRSQNVSDFARESEIDRTTLYRAFVRPRASFITVLRVLDALGLDLFVRPKRKPSRTK